MEDDRSGKPDRTFPTGYSKMDYGRSWSSQEWKSEVTAQDRSGKLDESSWNAVQQICPHHEDALLDGNAHSVRYGEIIHDGSGQLDSANYQEEADSEIFVMGNDAATLKNMFDISEKLVSEQEEINNVDKIYWKNHSWKQLSLIGDETVINLQRAKVYVFSDSVLCLGKIHQHRESNEAWKKRIEGVKSDKSYRDYDGINGEPTEFEWNIFPGFTTLQLCGKVQ